MTTSENKQAQALIVYALLAYVITRELWLCHGRLLEGFLEGCSVNINECDNYMHPSTNVNMYDVSVEC